MNEAMPFGQWLKKRRRELDLTQEQFADLVGCSWEYVRKIEDGTRRPSRQVAERFAEYLVIPRDEYEAFLQYARLGTTNAPSVSHFPANGQHLPSNLPIQLTSFIGRQTEVARACSLLRRGDVRLFTLTGPPGIGKTRLSLQLAAQLLDAFGGRVYFVALSPITDPALVIPAIAETLEVEESTDQGLLESLKVYLKDKLTLLVLDNFEHVVTAGPQVAELLTAAPNLKVLVTSRAVLHIYGEREFPVPPLSMPDAKEVVSLEESAQYEAIQLFLQRSQAVDPNFTLNLHNVPIVAEICRQLDGLPLAIELAAARVKVLPTQAILERLQQRLNLLTGGAQDLVPRQRTLRGAIEWSYHLLTDTEKALFRRLGVFMNGGTLEAIEAICKLPGEDEIDILEGLTSLLDKSLIRREDNVGGETRYWMLWTIREYALEQLKEKGEFEAIGGQHTRFYLSLAEEAEPRLHGSESPLWLDILEAEHDNIRGALTRCWNQREIEHSNEIVEIGLRLAGALWPFWQVRGYRSEGRDQLGIALSGTKGATPWRAKALNATARLALDLSDYATAYTLYSDSLRIWRKLGDKLGISISLNGLGHIALFHNEFATARSLYEESLAVRKSLEDQVAIIGSLNSLAGLALREGDYGRAEALYQESLQLGRQFNDKGSIGYSLSFLGGISLRMSEYSRAKALLQEGLALHQELGDKALVAGTLHVLGELARHQSEYESARSLYEQSLKIEKGIGSNVGIARTLSSLATLISGREDPTFAHSLFKETLLLLRGHWDENAQIIAQSMVGLATLAYKEGQHDKALCLLSAVDVLQRAHAAALLPYDRMAFDNLKGILSKEVGEATFQAAWSRGQAMTLEQALEFALTVVEAPPHSE